MIVKRANSKYFHTDFSIDNIRIRKSTKTNLRKEAMTYAIDLRSKMWKEIRQGYKKFVLNDVIDYFEKSNQMKDYSRSRKYLYERTIKYLKIYFKNKEFNLANFYLWVDYIEKLSNKKKLSGSQLRKYSSAVNVIINYAYKKHRIALNPIQNIDKSYFPKEKVVERFLSKEEFIRLSNTLKLYPDVEDYVIFAINTGLRQGEQLKLVWERVDLANNEIYLTETKTDKNRMVLLCNKSLNILASRRKFNKPFDMKVSNLNSAWRKILKEAEINNFRWHDLRHTFASWCVKGWHDWLEKPMDLYRLSRWLGHTNIKQTQRYAHLCVEDLREDIKENITYY